GRQHTCLAGRLRVADRSFEHHGHRGDAGVRVPAELHLHGCSPPVEVEAIEEHEGFDELAEVGGTHEPGDRAARVSARAVDDFTDGLLKLTCQHDLPPMRWCCWISGGSAELLEQLNERRALGFREPMRRPISLTGCGPL